MKYLPLSQIKSNLYTKGGEFIVESTNKPYKGYYYETSKGEYFSGKTPQDKPSTKLTFVKEETFDISENIVSTNVPSFWTVQEINYSNFNDNNAPSSPISYYAKPTQKAYELGEFERYFLSKRNEIKFLEVNEFTFNQYLNQDPYVQYQLYTPIKLSWELTGVKEKVYEVNYRTVERVQNNFKLRGFIEYFRGRFDKFYKVIG